jgi:hypothetical protein
MPLCGCVALLALGACRAPVIDEEAPLEIVEVDRGPTAAFSPDEDVIGQRTVDRVAGALPGNFPSDLPIYEPSSVSDFGPLGERQSFLVLHSDRSPSQVTEAVRIALDGSGWARDGDAFRRKKGQLVARYSIHAASRGGTEIRIEYGLP